jgi:mono/diheme cytochrome c family protein
VPAAPPPPKPDSYVVAAYKRRNRIPYWAMLALALLPLWAFMYARAVTTQAVEAAGPLAVGTETYSVCASCHGGDGSGGVGYPFTDGEVLKTFPHIEDQLRFVYYGSEQYAAAGVDIYGDPNREGGPHVVLGRNGAAMPAWGGNLTDAEILGVVCHERYDLGGADPTDLATEYDQWCGEESEIFADLEAGGDIRTLEQRFPDIIAIGEAPVAGSPAGG